MSDEQGWWFPKREPGVGWDLPTCWQGWIALAVYVVSMVVGVTVAGEKYGARGQLLVGSLLSAAMAVVLLLKGEPLR